MEETPSEQPLYLLLDGNSEYKTDPTKDELKEIPLANIKFFSSHNSFIQDAQFGGLLTYNTIKEMIKLSQFMPICLELDISYLSLKSNKSIFLDHITQRAHIFKSIEKPSNETIRAEVKPVTKPKKIRRRSSIFSKNEAYGFEEVKHFACYNKAYHSKIQDLYSLDAVFKNIKKLLDNLGTDVTTFPIV